MFGFFPFISGMRSMESQVPELSCSVPKQGQKNIFFNMYIYVRHWQEGDSSILFPSPFGFNALATA